MAFETVGGMEREALGLQTEPVSVVRRPQSSSTGTAGMSELIEVPPPGGLTADEMQKRHGWNREQLKARRRRHWIEDQHYAKVGGEWIYYWGEIDSWLMSGQKTTGSQSASRSQASGKNHSSPPSISNPIRRTSRRLSDRLLQQNTDSNLANPGKSSEPSSGANVSPLPTR